MKQAKLVLSLLGAAAAIVTADKARLRLRLSRAKHPSLTGHVRMAKRVAGLVPNYALGSDAFFRADDAPLSVTGRRRAAFERLAEIYDQRFAKTRAYTAEIRDSIPDLAFTGAYRVPFQFSPLVREKLGAGSFYQSAAGVTLTDLDGNVFHDLTGSYGVNVLGVDAYRGMVAEGMRTTHDLGPTLAGLHPVVADNVRRLRDISGLDAVSFHMSGTEAVMQAVRLARYHTGRSHLVRFAGAYHGW